MKIKIKRFSGICIFIVFAILNLYSSTAFSAVPEIINYQGSLSDAGGNPVNATLNITFTLYDDQLAGSTLWQEVQSVTVTNGQFSVQFGADGGNPLDPTQFENPIFLGVQVDADTEMTPRQAITAVGYAFRSKTVESDTLNSLSCAAGEIPKFNGSVWACAADDDSTDTNAATICPNGTFLNGDGSCDPVITDTNTTYTAGSGLVLSRNTFSIPTGGIQNAHMAANSVDSNKVVNNSLTANDLAPNSVGASEIATNAVGSSEVSDNSLTADDLGPNSVRSEEIAGGAVGPSELADLGRGVGVNGSIIVPASAFTPNTETGDYVVSLVQGYIQPGAANKTICLVAPVVLPNGVEIRFLDISVLDNSGAKDIGPFRLRRVSFSSGSTSNSLATATSSGTAGTVRTFTGSAPTFPTVNGLAFSYHIEGCIVADPVSADNTRLFSARIRYD